MENIFIYNTLLGFFIALFWDILNRNKQSESSPKKFNLRFFLNDNVLRLFVTFGLSIMIMIAVYFNVKDVSMLFGKEWTELNNIAYIVIGAAPDLVISFAKRKAGFLQPEVTEGHIRK